MNPLPTTPDTAPERTFVIAEIGKNFIDREEPEEVSVYIEKAKKLIDAAKEAGADAVKFQTHEVTDEQANIEVVSPHFKGSDRYSWVTRNTQSTPASFWQEIKKYCDDKSILFFSTPMSRMAAEKLIPLDPPFWKVGSGDIFDYVLLDTLIETKKPIIISTGMTSLAELDELMSYLEKREATVIMLYCVSKYPCPPGEFNLATIELFKEKYPSIAIGFSDHSVDGHQVDLAAIKLGARIIEKHFSFSRDLWGADHKASITPDEMKAMVAAIRAGEAESVDPTPFYGDKTRELEGADSVFRPYFNKTLVAARDLAEGEVVTKDMLYAMRPRMYLDGLAANQFDTVIGKHVDTPLKRFEPVTAPHLA